MFSDKVVGPQKLHVGSRMNEYEVVCGLEKFSIAAEDEQQARILVAHCNRKGVKEVRSVKLIGPTSEAFIKKIS